MNEITTLDEFATKDVQHMAQTFKDFLPEYNRTCRAMGKRQSQFMDNVMTVSHPTPIRNLRQILAEITKTKDAIMENKFKLKEKKIDIELKEIELEKTDNDLIRAKIKNDIDRMNWELDNVKQYYVGAYKKLENYTIQYKMICEKFDIAGWTEEDFEAEEERYQIMTAFRQGLTAARSKGGLIDEGNHIYLNQIGINGSAAQFHVTQFLREEAECFKQGKEPTHQSVLNFLNAMAEKYKGCSAVL